MVCYTFILASKRAGALYVGSAEDLSAHILDHKFHRLGGLTRQYNITQLVYYEPHDDRDAAFERERFLKLSHRQWKLDLIEAFNPAWEDLYPLIARPGKCYRYANAQVPDSDIQEQKTTPGIKLGVQLSQDSEEFENQT